ncbi:MAG: rRNA maturation RNase YbeY [Pseudomonadota bacterium]|jgi:probable rRNA maturation factor|nr:rRNA maturation RNase YbeY [Alphaproteobacteria bacterium]
MIFNENIIDVLIADDRWLKWHTQQQWQNLIQRISEKTLNEVKIFSKVEISILLTNNTEIHDLNLKYRGKDKPTNVLSFPNLNQEELNDVDKDREFPVMLGDVVLAFETLLDEATQAKKNFLDHFNHLIVHGMLHLLGYDHEHDAEEEKMQKKEIKILQHFSINNPY